MKRLISLLLCVAVIFSLPMVAHADIGPKPSVRVSFDCIADDVVYYATLLSERKSTGPSSAWNGKDEYASYKDGEYEIWKWFADYKDGDGYYYLQEHWNCTGTHQLAWTYYPPSKFKILVYFPESGRHYVSDIYERYAFDSYYEIDMMKGAAEGKILTVEKNYDFTWEIISLIARIAVTILLELAIAFIFGYREKSAVRFIAIVNIITQVALNVALNIINYNMGSMAFVIFFVLLEIVVFVLEALLYGRLLKHFTARKADCFKTTAYAFTANAASFAAGLWLAHIIPGIF